MSFFFASSKRRSGSKLPSMWMWCSYGMLELVWWDQMLNIIESIHVIQERCHFRSSQDANNVTLVTLVGVSILLSTHLRYVEHRRTTHFGSSCKNSCKSVWHILAIVCTCDPRIHYRVAHEPLSSNMRCFWAFGGSHPMSVCKQPWRRYASTKSNMQ
jgi:hypothetical protein